MKPDSAFVRSDGAVKFNAETAVYLNFTVIIHPRHAENYSPLGLDKPFDNFCLAIFGMSVIDRHQRNNDFFRSLKKFFFSGVFSGKTVHNALCVFVHRL